MLKLREALLTVGVERLNGARYFTLDEVDAMLGEAIGGAAKDALHG